MQRRGARATPRALPRQLRRTRTNRLSRSSSGLNAAHRHPGAQPLAAVPLHSGSSGHILTRAATPDPSPIPASALAREAPHEQRQQAGVVVRMTSRMRLHLANQSPDVACHKRPSSVATQPSPEGTAQKSAEFPAGRPAQAHSGVAPSCRAHRWPVESQYAGGAHGVEAIRAPARPLQPTPVSAVRRLRSRR